MHSHPNLEPKLWNSDPRVRPNFADFTLELCRNTISQFGNGLIASQFQYLVKVIIKEFKIQLVRFIDPDQSIPWDFGVK